MDDRLFKKRSNNFKYFLSKLSIKVYCEIEYNGLISEL